MFAVGVSVSDTLWICWICVDCLNQTVWSKSIFVLIWKVIWLITSIYSKWILNSEKTTFAMSTISSTILKFANGLSKLKLTNSRQQKKNGNWTKRVHQIDEHAKVCYEVEHEFFCSLTSVKKQLPRETSSCVPSSTWLKRIRMRILLVKNDILLILIGIYSQLW